MFEKLTLSMMAIPVLGLGTWQMPMVISPTGGERGLEVGQMHRHGPKATKMKKVAANKDSLIPR